MIVLTLKWLALAHGSEVASAVEATESLSMCRLFESLKKIATSTAPLSSGLRNSSPETSIFVQNAYSVNELRKRCKHRVFQVALAIS